MAPTYTLPYLAGLTPPDWEIVLHDEIEGEVNYDEPVVLVGISAFTCLAPRAYAISDEYRKRGIPVVMGGIHPTALPEEALQHADAVVVGEAELVWEKLLDDFKNNKLQKIYKADRPSDLKKLPPARFDLLDPEIYTLNTVLLFTTRGCPYNCEYCSISVAHGPKFRRRPIDEVLEEIVYLKEKYLSEKDVGVDFIFADDNIWGDVKYFKDLFKEIIPLKVTWVAQASVDPCSDDKLIKLAVESGCKSLQMGFETIDPGNLKEINKCHNKPFLYKEVINKIHQSGLPIIGGFMVGFSHYTLSTFEEIEKFIVENRIELPSLAIPSPFPGTGLYEKLEKEKRIFSNDWSRYDFTDLVFEPHNMNRQELKKTYVDVHRRIFSEECIERRMEQFSEQHPWLTMINYNKSKYFYETDYTEWINE